MARKYSDLGERIAANSRLALPNETEAWYKGTPCWIWQGQKVRNRSGMWYARLSRWVRGKHIKEYAHRVSFRFFRSPGLKRCHVVSHLCNNSLCVNPDHLCASTQSTNMLYCVKSGRHVSQQESSSDLHARLTATHEEAKHYAVIEDESDVPF